MVIMLFIEIAKLELPGGHIEIIMLIIERVKIELTGRHIGIMLFIERVKIEITGGHIEIMLFIEIDKGESNSNISISINSIITTWIPENRIFKSPFLGLLAKLYLINVSCVVLVNPFLRVFFSLFSDFVSVATLALGVWKVSVLSSSSVSSTLKLF